METQQKNIPQLRFPDFLNDGEWEVKRLGEIAEKVTSKNKSNEQLPVLTNSATEGVVNQQDYFDREIVTRENLTNYHIIELNDFVYNPRISVAAPVGPISRNKIGIGIMSPLYTIFKFKEGNIDFFEQYFRTNCWHQYLKDKANFGARFDRMNISNEDFFNLPMPFPPLVEQRRIAACLSAIDEMLAATNEKLEQMKAYKKGLMQKLFPAKGKKLPELRFKEFENEGEWEEKKLATIVHRITTGKLDANAMVSNGKYRFYTCAKDYAFINEYAFDTEALLVSGNGAHLGYIHYYKGKFNAYQRTYVLSDFQCDIFYLKYYLESFLPDRINKEKKEGNTPYIVMSTLTEMDISLPSNSEQHNISDCLSSIDEMINQYTNKVALLELYKKGLMQQMFV